MFNSENPFKKTLITGAIAMGAAACAPGGGERAGSVNTHDAKMEQSAENSPEAVQKRLLGDLQIGLNDIGDGDIVLAVIGSGMSIDGAEEFARVELHKIKSQTSGISFLPSFGALKYEKASDGKYYVVLKLRGIKQ